MEVAHLRVVSHHAPRCFVEDDTSAPLVKRSIAEGVGTMMLMIAVVGSGLAGQGQALQSALAISGALIALILVFGSISGGHFNPVITIAQWRAGQRGLECTIWYVAAQIIGGLSGAVFSDVMFALPPGQPTVDFPSSHFVASEAIATFGLMIVVFCSSRSTSKLTGPFAVGLWLLGAIVATPTGSLANPAVTIALLASPTSSSLVSMGVFVIVQMIGADLASRLAGYLYPLQRR